MLTEGLKTKQCESLTSNMLECFRLDKNIVWGLERKISNVCFYEYVKYE